MRVREFYIAQLDEGVERMITEAFGVVQRVKDESLRIIHYIYEHLSEYAPTDGERFKISERNIDVTYSEHYMIPLIIKIYYFRTEKDLKQYRFQYPHPSPYYSKDEDEMYIELDVVNGDFDVFEFLYYLQHEIYHGYQVYCKKRNGADIKPNSKYYDKAKGLLSLTDKYEHGAASVLYLWGTYEMSAFENGLYAKLLQNFKSKNKQPIQNVIHDTSFYRMYSDIVSLQNNLENGGDVPDIFYMSTKMSKKKLMTIIKKVIKKSQDAMAKAVAKAKYDYDEWVREHGLGSDETPYYAGGLKSLTENRIRLYGTHSFVK